MERLSERVVRLLGTPKFIIGQSLFLVLWMSTAGFGLDRFPWVLLNLMLSTQAAYATPLILMGTAKDSRKNQDETRRIAEFEESEASTLKLILDKLNSPCKHCGQWSEQPVVREPLD